MLRSASESAQVPADFDSTSEIFGILYSTLTGSLKAVYIV